MGRGYGLRAVDLGYKTQKRGKKRWGETGGGEGLGRRIGGSSTPLPKHLQKRRGGSH